MLIFVFIIFAIIAYTFILGLAMRKICKEIVEVLTSKKSLIVLEVVKLICLFILLMPLSIIGCPVAIWVAYKQYRPKIRFVDLYNKKGINDTIYKN